MELMFVWGAPNVSKIGIESVTKKENILIIETMTESATFELHVAIGVWDPAVCARLRHAKDEHVGWK